MKNVHLVIADLFLPQEIAAEVCAGLSVPCTEMMLARGCRVASQDISLESRLCELFGMPGAGSVPIAPLSAAFDGLADGNWLRADPVHLSLRREQMVLLPDVAVNAEEAAQWCDALNAHFAGQGMAFFAPHPQRWYVRLEESSRIETVPLSRAAGRNVHDLLPGGDDAMHWHRVFNDIQMLLFAHPLNEAREARGELPVNSVWLWGYGEGRAALQPSYESVVSDDVLAAMLAGAAEIPFLEWPARWHDTESDGRQLLLWTGLRRALRQGDLRAWRDALQDFELNHARPLWQALRAGKIGQLQVEILSGDTSRGWQLKRADSWAFWRRARPLAEGAMV
ncbi:MAG: hypothetical protein IPM27_03230 [Nitrosomonadales bacterium]|nr:hypothetical protein [Nitrosomonadales bacterium]